MNVMKRTPSAFLIFLVLSLILHGLGTGVIYIVESPSLKAHDTSVQIDFDPQVTRIKSKEEDLKQIVEQNKSVNDETPDEKAFLGKENQTIKKQTVVKNRGEFRNASATNSIASQQKPMSATNLKQELFNPQRDWGKAAQKAMEVADDGVLPADNQMKASQGAEKKPQTAQNKNAEPQQNAAAKPTQQSQSVDYIKDLEPGLETLLSTREFVYYSFYARIRGQLSQHWGPKVKQRLQKLYSQGRQLATTEDKITKLLITLDVKGKLLKVQVIGDSGVRDLDEAAVEAFRASAPFPNPPKGIQEEDGTIKIRWDFILEA